MTRLKMPDDARALALFEGLNQRFFDFTDSLPSPLNSLARGRSTFLGSHEEGEFQGVPDLNPVLASTPWLFWESFNELQDEDFLNIAEAGTMFVLASILLDHLVDGQAEPAEQVALLHQAFYSHGVTTYRAVFPSDSHFWEHFDRLARAHVAGLARELETQRSSEDIDLQSLQKMAFGKVSPIITTMAALVEAQGPHSLLEPIETSLKHIAVASQMLDDIGDWQHDIGVGHRTYYLSHVAAKVGRGEGDGLIDEIQEAIDAEWADVKYLKLVIQWLDDSAHAVQGLACPGWLEYVEGYRQLSDEHLTTAIARHLVRKLGPMIDKSPPE